MLLHVKSLNDRLNSAYHNIAKLSALGEQSIINFDPANFNFMEKIDSIVQQIIRSRFDLIDSPSPIAVIRQYSFIMKMPRTERHRRLSKN